MHFVLVRFHFMTMLQSKKWLLIHLTKNSVPPPLHLHLLSFSSRFFILFFELYKFLF
jgi:hypothetical protein